VSIQETPTSTLEESTSHHSLIPYLTAFDDEIKSNFSTQVVEPIY